MILKKKLEEILKEFYDSKLEDFEININKAEDIIIKLFVDSINKNEFKQENIACG